MDRHVNTINVRFREVPLYLKKKPKQTNKKKGNCIITSRITIIITNLHTFRTEHSLFYL